MESTESQINLKNNKGKAVLKAQTVMSRGLLIAEFYINLKVKQKKTKETDEPAIIEKMFPIYVATSHFESLDAAGFKENRFTQMHDTFGVILKNEPNCIVLGDYNFDNKKEYETNVTNHGFEDVVTTQFRTNE